MYQILGAAAVFFLIFGMARSSSQRLRGAVPIGVGWLFGVFAAMSASAEDGHGFGGEMLLRIFAISALAFGAWWYAAKGTNLK